MPAGHCPLAVRALAGVAARAAAVRSQRRAPRSVPGHLDDGVNAVTNRRRDSARLTNSCIIAEHTRARETLNISFSLANHDASVHPRAALQIFALRAFAPRMRMVQVQDGGACSSRNGLTGKGVERG